jgi:hypothetical protein
VNAKEAKQVADEQIRYKQEEAHRRLSRQFEELSKLIDQEAIKGNCTLRLYGVTLTASTRYNLQEQGFEVKKLSWFLKFAYDCDYIISWDN